MKDSEFQGGGSAAAPVAPIPAPPLHTPGANGAARVETSLDDAARREILWKTLGRYDHYISTMNNKAAMVAAFDAFVLGASVLKVQEVLKTFEGSPRLHHLAVLAMVVIALSASASIAASMRVIWPYLESGKRGSGKTSLIFFGHVSTLTTATFVSSVRTVTSEDLLEDLGGQVLAVAAGLEKKTTYVKSANWGVVVQLVALVALGVLGLVAVGW